jgi:integrase
MGKLTLGNQHRGHHEGSYRLRKDGRWECLFTLPNGQRKSVYGKSKPDVPAKMEDALDKARKGIDLKGERQTLRTFLDTWFTDVVTPKNRPRTLASYRSNLDHHILPALGHLSLRDLTPQDVQRFLNEKSKTGLSPRSLQYLRAILRAALGQAVRWGYVERNAASLATPPRQQPKVITALSAGQAEALIHATVNDRLGNLFAAALYSGMLGLRWPDVDLEAGTVRVRQAVQKIDGGWEFVEPKSANGRRTIPLAPPAVDVLRRQKERVRAMRQQADMAWQEWGLVFPSALGTPQTAATSPTTCSVAWQLQTSLA